MLWVRAYGTDYCDAGLATPQVHSQNFLTVIISLIKVFFDASHFSACHETLRVLLWTWSGSVAHPVLKTVSLRFLINICCLKKLPLNSII